MSIQWIEMRISEEKDRREREALVQERLPRALDELYGDLQQCVEAYRAAFGTESAEIGMRGAGIQVTVRKRRTGQWQQSRSEEHTSELQSLRHLVCRLLLEK